MKAVIAGLMLVASAAVAAPHQQLSFEELKMACKDPKKFQNQLEPASIKMDCSDKVLKYVPAGEGTMTMPAKRTVYFNVSSDKYTVPNSQEEVREESFTGSCPVLKQIEEIISVSQEVTCEQIKNYQGTATQLCISLLDGMKKDNPSAVQTRETGKVVSFCKADGIGNNPGKQQPGKKPLK